MQAQSKIITLPRRTADLSARREVRKRRARGDRLLMAIFVLFLCYVAITIGQQEIRLRHLRQQLQAINLERDQQLVEKQRLEEQLTEVSSDLYIERIARDKLGLLKPGDYIYLIGKSGTRP